MYGNDVFFLIKSLVQEHLIFSRTGF